MVSLSALHLRAARARIAAAVLPPPAEPRVGTVTLWPEQCATAARVERALARDGGCLLADDVGRGKTFVALAVARRWSRPLVVSPAALRGAWSEAMRRSGVTCDLVSHEALSRGARPAGPPDGIVVDESHRFRSPDARRYIALARLAARAEVVLLSATPLQNRRRDLAAQVALFHGARAFGLDASALAAFVVRSGAPVEGATLASVGSGSGVRDPDSMPVVAPAEWVRPVADDGAVLEALLALPSPARAADAGEAAALRTIALVRAWASSRAALCAMLSRRRRIAAGIEQSVADGLVPTRRELRTWHAVDGAVQLGFAPMLVSGAVDPARAGALLRDVTREHVALAALDRVIAGQEDVDVARAAALRRIRASHSGEAALAFTELASTARAYYEALRAEPGVGLLTAREARIASGPLSRDELLARFAPRALGAPPPPERERVTLLIATDLLSEGLNLQDASVVVHLDLPWNPARLAQRVGRVRRPGGAAVVRSYLVAPPARAELLLDVERRLRGKLAESERTIGRGIEVMPVLGPRSPAAAAGIGHAATWGEALATAARWRRAGRPRRRGGRESPIVAGVASAVGGWLAALDDGRLVASLDGAAPAVDAAAVRAVVLGDGDARSVSDDERGSVLAGCRCWVAAESLRRDCGRDAEPQPLDLAVERALARALSRAPRHERPGVGARAKELRDLLHRPRPLGAEWAVRDVLVEAEETGTSDWIRAAVDILIAVPQRRATAEAGRVVAMIAFGGTMTTGAPDGER